MSELTPYWIINPDHKEKWTPEELEAAVFLQKMHWEGGLDDLLDYGGPAYFPVELRELAKLYEHFRQVFEGAITKWAKERGVSR